MAVCVSGDGNIHFDGPLRLLGKIASHTPVKCLASDDDDLVHSRDGPGASNRVLERGPLHRGLRGAIQQHLPLTQGRRISTHPDHP